MVGKCSMDRNSPDYYVESTEDAISSARDFVESFPHLSAPASASSSTPLVQPILTPRMAISTTAELLGALRDLAKSYDPPLPFQTHLSENEKEIAFTKSLFPECKTYAQVYDKFDLLGPGTILAHCVHLEEEERRLISARGAGVSHCPTSNFHLGSGCARVREMLDSGINVGRNRSHEATADSRLDWEAIVPADTRTASYLSFGLPRTSPINTRTPQQHRINH